MQKNVKFRHFFNFFGKSKFEPYVDSHKLFLADLKNAKNLAKN